MINLVNLQSVQATTLSQDRARVLNSASATLDTKASTSLNTTEPNVIPAVLIGSISDNTGSSASTTVVQPSVATSQTDPNRQSTKSDTNSDVGLSSQERAIVRELSAREREVRQHELAHKSAAGSLAGAIKYDYQRGPDGRLYAVGGEVSIKLPPASADPAETLRQAEQVLRAATAPAEPSAQDLRVAAAAQVIAQEARAEIALERVQETTDGGDSTDDAELSSSRDQSATEPETKRSVFGEEKTDFFSEAQERREAVSEELAEFRDRLVEVQESLASVNQKLNDLGVLEALYSPGELIDEQS